MRKYGYLNTAIRVNKKELIYKIMIHETKKGGVFVYLYTSLTAENCSYDCHYETLEDALEEWQEELDERGWIEIPDPLPYCQHDSFLPIRVKGSDIGKPQIGQVRET